MKSIEPRYQVAGGKFTIEELRRAFAAGQISPDAVYLDEICEKWFPVVDLLSSIPPPRTEYILTMKKKRNPLLASFFYFLAGLSMIGCVFGAFSASGIVQFYWIAAGIVQAALFAGFARALESLARIESKK